jgi:hypothetical protein
MFAYGLAKPNQKSTPNGTQAESNHSTDHASEMERDLKQIADALWELHVLLEQYAPAWYTQQYDEKAASALRAVGRI